MTQTLTKNMKQVILMITMIFIGTQLQAVNLRNTSDLSKKQLRILDEQVLFIDKVDNTNKVAYVFCDLLCPYAKQYITNIHKKGYTVKIIL